MNVAGIPVEIDDPLNAAILTVSEDRVEGFHRDPLGKIAPEIGAGIQQDYRTVIQPTNGQTFKSFRTAQGVPGKSPQQIFVAGVADVDDEAFIFFDHRTDGPSMVQANADAQRFKT